MRSVCWHALQAHAPEKCWGQVRGFLLSRLQGSRFEGLGFTGQGFLSGLGEVRSVVSHMLPGLTVSGDCTTPDAKTGLGMQAACRRELWVHEDDADDIDSMTLWWV